MSRFTVERPMEIEMFGFGGTWAMQVQDGVRRGHGVLGDEELFKMERDLGVIDLIRYGSKRSGLVNNIFDSEKRLAEAIYKRIGQVEPVDSAKQLSSWCPEFGDYTQGPLWNVFNGDSVHYRAAVAAPLGAFWISHKLKNPSRPTLAGRGTDTADRELTPQVDVHEFDTELAPDIVSGANNPYEVVGSDAPLNFTDMAKLSHIHLRAGVYWPFHRFVYTPADLEKFNPNESRPIEGRSTFIDPQGSAVQIQALLEFGQRADYSQAKVPPADHVIHKINWESLFDAMSSVYTLDLGNQNAVWDEVGHILNPQNKAIVVAGHGTGAANDIIREACIEAARRGSLVFVTTRALIGIVEGNYSTSLVSAGLLREWEIATFQQTPDHQLLQHPSAEMINGGRLSKGPLRAIATRAILEGRDAKSTQQLVKDYSLARRLDF